MLCIVAEECGRWVVVGGRGSGCGVSGKAVADYSSTQLMLRARAQVCRLFQVVPPRFEDSKVTFSRKSHRQWLPFGMVTRGLVHLGRNIYFKKLSHHKSAKKGGVAR